MSEALTLPETSPSSAESAQRGLVWRIAWRNLWRNKRRTWLTAAGIAFATFLVGIGISMQGGSYGAMIETATRFYMGQVQITRSDYIDSPKLERTLRDSNALAQQITEVPGVTLASPRVQSFALVSAGERSFGGMVIGLDIGVEKEGLDFLHTVEQGRLPTAADEVLLGAAMARNLGAQVGDEVVILGTANEGGVAALALTVVGLFVAPQVEFERTFLFAALEAVQEGFALVDESHLLVVVSDPNGDLTGLAARLNAQLPDGVVARTWQEFMPEVVQSIEFDRIGAYIMYGAILVLVTFSVVNTFLMIVFERTREFGMLVAIGMRPWQIVRQLHLEAAFVWLTGVALGLALTVGLVAWVTSVGIPIPEMEGMTEQFFMPNRIYPQLNGELFTLAPLTLLIGTQAAAFMATLRIHRVSPTEALRAD